MSTLTSITLAAVCLAATPTEPESDSSVEAKRSQAVSELLSELQEVGQHKPDPDLRAVQVPEYQADGKATGMFNTPPTRIRMKLRINAQPDYAKWKRLRVGMSGKEVVALIGPPYGRRADLDLDISRGSDKIAFNMPVGGIAYEFPALRYGYDFRISFHNGKVTDFSDPFDGDLSIDGKPTLPKHAIPKNGAKLVHPRHGGYSVDLRWQPSSGEYPMEYLIEVEQHIPEWDGKPAYYKLDQTLISDGPYAAIGSGDCRWRIQARNSKGKSGWTEWSYFTTDYE